MRRRVTAVIAVLLMAFGPSQPLFAQRSAQRGIRVSAASGGTKTRSGRHDDTNRRRRQGDGARAP